MTLSKLRALVYGNCQGGWLARALSGNPEIATRFEIVYVTDYHARPRNQPVDAPGYLNTCAVVIWQTASGCQRPPLLANVPSHVRQIRYPTLWMKLLWPTYAVDPRNQPTNEFPWGAYPYGDRLVMKLLEEGVPVSDISKRYIETDLNTVVNLARFTEMSLSELRFNDRQSDISIAPFIERTLRTRRLFGAVNHPTSAILHHIYHGLATALLDRPSPDDPPLPANAADVLGEEEIPLHPQIVDHFGLKWAFPGMRCRYHSAFLTIEEYLDAYASFRPIPLGHPAPLWMARAQQAAERHDLEEAKRILLEASAKFPGDHKFLLYLGRILANHERVAAAEHVLRFAVGRHPQAAVLRTELALLQLQHQAGG